MAHEKEEFLDESGLQYVINKFMTLFAKIMHTHELSDISDYKVDDTLSSTSINPVQNKAVNSALSGKVPTTRTVNGKALSSNITLSASDVGADLSGTASSAVSSHNTNTSAHNDIRELILSLSTKVNNFLDVTDTTKDELSEVISLIETNEDLIEAITISKVNVTDIVNNLTTNVTNKPLSSAQGVIIKELIDTVQEAINTEKSDREKDINIINDKISVNESEIDTLQTEIDTLEILVQANKAAHEANAAVIALKASQSDVNALDARVDNIEIAISAKAEKNDLDVAIERIGINETNIANNASAIASFSPISKTDIQGLFS